MTLVSDPWQGLWVLDINTNYFTFFLVLFQKKNFNLIFQHLIYWKLIFELLPFAFLSTWLFQSYIHGCKVNWLTQIDLNIFFSFLLLNIFFFNYIFGLFGHRLSQSYIWVALVSQSGCPSITTRSQI
jgi:hypothetical protein